jgi:hypothetical protein
MGSTAGGEDLVEVEADGAAELEPGELAALPPVEDRARLEADRLAELAGSEQFAVHDP